MFLLLMIPQELTFMDFCAGVGGGRLGLTNIGLKCVGFSEIDKAAEKTYRLIHNADEENLVLDSRQSDLRLYRNRVPTLRLGRHGILYVKNKKFRKLSGYESLLLQGFPKKIALKAKENISDGDLLRQSGNAMTVTTIQAVGEKMIESINEVSV